MSAPLVHRDRRVEWSAGLAASAGGFVLPLPAADIREQTGLAPCLSGLFNDYDMMTGPVWAFGSQVIDSPIYVKYLTSKISLPFPIGSIDHGYGCANKQMRQLSWPKKATRNS
ncbi:MAG: hypothetical protein KQH59_09215 [Desulfobulbaceae bacterium]|nr:hypothetical protein [Desulfobulbaceae bacterium]